MKPWGKVRLNKRRGLWYVDGSWKGKRVNIYLIPTRSGFMSCATEDMAKYLQGEISRDIAQETFNPARYKKSKPLIMAKYAESWLKIKEKTNISYKTLEGYRGIVANYIKKLPIGKKNLEYITHEDLQLFVNDLKAAGLEIKSQKNKYALLYQILRYADKCDHITKLPAPVSFELPVKEIEWLDRDHQEKILAEMPPQHHYIFRFIFLTGVRPSEARALRKKDLKDITISIKKTFANVKGHGEVLAIVKNKKEGSIPFYRAVRDLLDSMPPTLTEYVFINPVTGRPYTKNINRDIWNPACRAALGFVFPLKNSGRHAFANQMLAAGMSIEEVSKLLRHSSTSVTKENYGRPNLKVIGAKVDKVQGG